MNITPARAKILRLIAANDGMIYGAALGGPGRSQVSRMASEKLVRWEPPRPRCEDLSMWKIYITDAGRAALDQR